MRGCLLSGDLNYLRIIRLISLDESKLVTEPAEPRRLPEVLTTAEIDFATSPSHCSSLGACFRVLQTDKRLRTSAQSFFNKSGNFAMFEATLHASSLVSRFVRPRRTGSSSKYT